MATVQTARERAQAIINHANKKNSTFDNVEELLLLIEEVEPKADARDIADMFSSHMGACVPWDRNTNFGFQNATNLLSWRDCYSLNIEVTISHAFAAVSMKYVAPLGNALINHSADFVDGIIKGVQGQRAGKGFSMEYGYGKPNKLGDYLGNYMATQLHFDKHMKLSAAFKGGRKKMQL